MAVESMAMPMPQNNLEKESNQEKESWKTQVWEGFKNKFNEYTAEDSHFGRAVEWSKERITEHTDKDSNFGKSVDWAKGKLEELSSSDRFQFLDGLSKIGNQANILKNNGMATISIGMANTFKNKHLKKFFEKNVDHYTEKSNQAYDDLEKLKKGELKDLGRLKGVSQGLVSNFLRFGRVISDVAQINPLRHVMAGSMFIGHNSEMIKQVRLDSESAMKKTRVDDFDRAYEEAWGLHEKVAAKQEKGEFSREEWADELTKVYRENLPKDILERFGRNENFEGSNFLQKCMILHMKHNADKVEAELEKIDSSDFSEPEKEARRAVIFQRNKKLLEDLEGMVSDQGTIDIFAYLARASEKTGKAVATVMTVETAIESVPRFAKLAGKLGKAFWEWTDVPSLRAEELAKGMGGTAEKPKPTIESKTAAADTASAVKSIDEKAEAKIGRKEATVKPVEDQVNPEKIDLVEKFSPEQKSLYEEALAWVARNKGSDIFTKEELAEYIRRPIAVERKKDFLRFIQLELTKRDSGFGGNLLIHAEHGGLKESFEGFVPGKELAEKNSKFFDLDKEGLRESYKIENGMLFRSDGGKMPLPPEGWKITGDGDGGLDLTSPEGDKFYFYVDPELSKNETFPLYRLAPVNDKNGINTEKDSIDKVAWLKEFVEKEKATEKFNKLIKTGDGKGLKKFIEDNADIFVGRRFKDGKTEATLTLKPGAKAVQSQIEEAIAVLKKNKDCADIEYVVKKAAAVDGVSGKTEGTETKEFSTQLDQATIRKGEGIEHALIRQLSAKPESYGYDSKKHGSIEKWAGAEAHRIALKAGYVDAKTGKEIRIGTKGIDKVAYMLGRDTKGGVTVDEYLGKEQIESHGFIDKPEFEGKHREDYEYVYGKKAGLAKGLKIKDVAPLPDVKIAPIELIPESEPVTATMDTPEAITMDTPVDSSLSKDLDEKVFKHWSDFIPGSDKEKAEVWKGLSDISAKDALEGNFPVIGDSDDAAENAYTSNLQAYIAEVQTKNGLKFKPNETVKQFLNRATRENERLDRPMEIAKNVARFKGTKFDDPEAMKTEQKEEEKNIESDQPKSHIEKIKSVVNARFDYDKQGKLSEVYLIAAGMENLNFRTYLVDPNFSLGTKQEFQLQQIATARETMTELKKLGILKNSVEYLGVQKELKNVIEEFKQESPPGVLDEKKALGEDVTDRKVIENIGKERSKMPAFKQEPVKSGKGIRRELSVEEGETEPQKPTVVRHKTGAIAKEQIINEKDARPPKNTGPVSEKVAEAISRQQAADAENLSKTGRPRKAEMPSGVVIDGHVLNKDEVETYKGSHEKKSMKSLERYFKQIKNDKNISKEEKYAIQELIKEKSLGRKAAVVARFGRESGNDSGKVVARFGR